MAHVVMEWAVYIMDLWATLVASSTWVVLTGSSSLSPSLLSDSSLAAPSPSASYPKHLAP